MQNWLFTYLRIKGNIMARKIKDDINKDIKQAKSLKDLKRKRSEEELIAAVNETNDKKESKFLDAINKYAKEQREKIYAETKEFKDKELKKAEDKVLNDAYNLIQNEMMAMKKDITSKISKEEIHARKVLFEKRNTIIGEVFKEAQNKLLSFTHSEKYFDLLQKQAQAILNTLSLDGTVIFMRKEDLDIVKSIEQNIKSEHVFSFEEADDINIGGLRGYNHEMGLVADETLDTKLELQYYWFQRNSGLTVV
jgi:V/A-type H+-transporting ATPase subunit E